MKYVSLEKWFSTEKHIGNERVWGMQQLQQQIKGKNCENTKKNFFFDTKTRILHRKTFLLSVKCAIAIANFPLANWVYSYDLDAGNGFISWSSEKRVLLVETFASVCQKEKVCCTRMEKTNMF